MSNFQKSWTRPASDGVSNQIKGMVRKEGPLKPRVESAVRRLNQPLAKIDSMSNRLAEKDARLFQRIVEAQRNHDTRTSKVLATELAELRKSEKMLGNMRMSLEQVQTRLSTVNELGDAVVALGPAMSTMRSLGPALGKFMPEASAEFDAMGETLGGLMTNSFEGSFDSDGGISSQETDSILREAAAVAENEIGEKFPSVPASTSASGYSTTNEAF